MAPRTPAATPLAAVIGAALPLEGVNDGYQDMRDGKNIRGVIVYE